MFYLTEVSPGGRPLRHVELRPDGAALASRRLADQPAARPPRPQYTAEMSRADFDAARDRARPDPDATP